MGQTRRTFLRQSGLASLGAGFAGLSAGGSMAAVIGAARPVWAERADPGFTGYGPLQPDPDGILDLPAGFSYKAFSREREPLTGGGIVPSSHDGMAAFPAGTNQTYLVRNHELNVDDITEEGLTAVEHVGGATYDPAGVGGTTTLLIGPGRTLVSHRISLSGTLDNCAGGPTPWGSWLTCEETTDTLSKQHGYVFEVDPATGGNPVPIRAMGRFEHEAVAIDPRTGNAYLTEDADSPFGCLYRYRPKMPLRGLGSLHAGGKLTALRVPGVAEDLSEVLTPGTTFPQLQWVVVPEVNPGDGATTVREQVIAAGATPIQKCEGIWFGDGSLWFTSSRGGGPAAEDEAERSAAEHGGQIWRYDPVAGTLKLVAIFELGGQFDEPDNIVVGPHGFAIACTDSEAEQWLVGITAEGRTFPFAFNALNDVEFAGATFSPDGQTLFVNIQGEPAATFAIWGPWRPA